MTHFSRNRHGGFIWPTRPTVSRDHYKLIVSFVSLKLALSSPFFLVALLLFLGVPGAEQITNLECDVGESEKEYERCGGRVSHRERAAKYKDETSYSNLLIHASGSQQAMP